MNIKNMFLEKHSLKGRFNRFLLFIFFFISLVFFISNIVSYYSLQKYSHTVKQYSELSSFYSNIESLNQGVINYLYTSKYEEIDDYNVYRQKALDNLNFLRTDCSEDWAFRLGLLANMIETYTDRVDNVLIKDDNYDQLSEYDSFEHLTELIVDTYSRYSQLLTREVEKEQEEMTRIWHLQIEIILFLFVIILGISILFSVHSVRSITRPINDIIGNINKIKEGEFHVETVQVNNREISILLNSFEEMAVKIHDFIDQIKEKSKIEKQLIETENENLRITKTLTESRLIALQEQMNPHFLFNTLSMISKQAYIEGAEITSGLMVRTANLLRYSMEMSSKISNLSLELESINNYFDIQRRRMGNRVEFRIEAEGVFESVKIPGMIIQPLVENCILHGIKDMIKNAVISVEIRKFHDRFEITVEDNGIGIEPELLEKLNNQENSENSRRIGLQNLKKRLSLCYGEDYLFFIESDQECGTVVTLNIPDIIKQDQNVYTIVS